MEQWRDIPGYEGIYQASNLGNIRTAENKITYSRRHGIRHWKQRTLKPKNDRQNCLRVTLWKDGKCKDFLLARLVCTTWHDNLIDTDFTVNHIDGNRMNNRADNLEWLSRADNIRHGFENGLYSSATKVVLTNIKTSQSLVYRSESAASAAIGRCHGYICACLKRNAQAVGVDGQTYQIEIR